MKIIRRTVRNPLAEAFAEPLSLEGEIEYCKLEAVEEPLQFMKREGINRSELADRLGVPPSRITKLLNGTENLTIATLVRAGRAVGAELKIRFQPAKQEGNTTETASIEEPSANTRNPDGTETIIFRSTLPLGSRVREFLRLKVTTP